MRDLGDVRSPADSEAGLDEKRAERLKIALRDNLRRRKAAARPAPAETPDEGAARENGRDGSKADGS